MTDEWDSFLSGKPSSYKQPNKKPYEHKKIDRASTQEILDSLAMGSSVIPGVGDAMGLAADINMYKNDPESRTAGNFALSALGLLPFVPSAAGVVKRALPGKEFFNDFLNTTIEHPLDSKSRILMNKNSKSATDFASLEISPVGENIIRLNSIQASKTTKGNGSYALNKLIELADKHNQAIILEPHSFGSIEKKLTNRQLKNWYKKKGFQEIKDSDQMVRNPTNSMGTQTDFTAPSVPTTAIGVSLEEIGDRGVPTPIKLRGFKNVY